MLPRAVSFLDGRNDLPTAIRGPPPPRVAHSTPLGLLYLGTHAFFCRAAGSVVAPGFAVPPRPSGACSEGVCTRLGGFPVPRRKAHGRGASARQPEKSPASWLAAFSLRSLPLVGRGDFPQPQKQLRVGREVCAMHRCRERCSETACHNAWCIVSARHRCAMQQRRCTHELVLEQI